MKPKVRDSTLVEFIIDQLDGIGAVHSRAMFGGHGIYVDGVIVGLVADETLYLKVDQGNIGRFEEADSSPFTYHNAKSGKQVAMSYWAVPEEVLEDGPQLVEWAQTSWEASKRSKTKPAKAGVRGASKAKKA